MQIEKLLQKAGRLTKRGDKAQAVKIYQTILAKYPQNITAKRELKKLAPDSTAQEKAKAIQQLVALFNKSDFNSVLQLGQKLLGVGVTEPVVHNLMAASYVSTGQQSEAVPHFQIVVQLNPDYAEGFNNLGNVLLETGRYAEAEVALKKAMKLRPNWPDAAYNLGVAYSQQGNNEKAIEVYEKALELAPNALNIINNLSALLNNLKRFDEAIELLTKLIDQGTHSSVPYSNRGISYTKKYRYKEAEADFLKAKELGANVSGYYQGYAEVLIALKNYQKGIELLQDGTVNSNYEPSTHDALLLNQIYIANKSSAKTYNNAGVYGECTMGYVNSLKTPCSFSEEIRQGKLKIGYVSPDFKNHSVARFFEPLLVSHTDQFEVFCYYNNKVSDDITKRIELACDHWRDISRLTYIELYNQIRSDNVDILVDLAGHTSGNSLPVFAMGAAPIQISWLGFPDTTGLPTIDYRLVDSRTDPEGQDEEYYTETLYRLPGSFLTYQGDYSVEMETASPIENKGYITFGSFNNLSKVTTDVINTWSEILKRVDNSKLLLKSPQFSEPEMLDFYEQLFAKEGITADRLIFVEKTATVQEHLALYREIDICLDTFPYNGATTTCEALWMGAPVVAYTGARHAARVSASILKHTGLADWIADDIEGYINLAVEKANNPEELQSLRIGLREQMKASPICDHKQFAADMEAAYQDMWQRHLDKAGDRPQV